MGWHTRVSLVCVCVFVVSGERKRWSISLSDVCLMSAVPETSVWSSPETRACRCEGDYMMGYLSCFSIEFRISLYLYGCSFGLVRLIKFCFYRHTVVMSRGWALIPSDLSHEVKRFSIEIHYSIYYFNSCHLYIMEQLKSLIKHIQKSFISKPSVFEFKNTQDMWKTHHAVSFSLLWASYITLINMK